MATRMQQRRGTAAQWTSTNNGDGPILNAGEIGFESDTGKFKIGDGVNHWVDLDYFLDESDITGITGDYVLANTLGQANGVATLDSSGKLTGSQIPGIDELAQDAVDLALVAGTGISKTYNDNANTITIAVDTSVIATKAELAEVSQDSINDAITAGTGITKSYDDNANTITISTSNIPNTSLANSEVTINGFAISLGGSATYSSDNIGEGTTNLYFTNARSRATLSGGTGLDYNASTGQFDIDSTVTTNDGSQTLTNKSINLANNTVSGTVAEFNTALSDANFVTTSDTGTVTSTMLADETIVNADISNNAAIAQSKIANLTTDLGNKQDKVSGVSDTEIGYLDGVTSNIQAQLDAKAALSGAAFTGNVSTTGNFTVDGNFTVNGSNVLVSATQIQIEDSIVQLAHQNPANTVDLGIVAGYNDGSAKHAGLVKDATDGKWKLFDGVTDEPSTTVNFAQASYDDLVVGGLEASSLTVGDVSNTEFGYLANVTSDIQTQLNSKASSTDLSNHESDTTNIHGIANTAALVSTTDTGTVTSTMLADETIVNADIANNAAIAQSKIANLTTDLGNKQDKVSGVSDTEIGYLDGVTSNVQAQIDNKISASSTDTLLNKTLNLANNTVSGTIAQFNTALSDADFATLAGTETLSNKTLSSPTITTSGSSSFTVYSTNGYFSDSTFNSSTSGPMTPTVVTYNAVNNDVVIYYGDYSGGNPVYIANNNNGTITNKFTGISGTHYTVESASLYSVGFPGDVVVRIHLSNLAPNVDTSDLSKVVVAIYDGVFALVKPFSYAPPLAKTISSTEIGYLDGVVSNIQNQIDSKAPYADTISATSTNTLTNKTINLTNNTITGTVAQFNSALSDANFITTTDTATVTNAMLAGSIANNKLANSAITINGSAVSLGGTVTIASEPTLHTVFAMV